MELTATTTFTGPSVYAQHPIVRFRVVGQDPSGPPPLDHPLLAELVESLPELSARSDSCESNAFEPTRHRRKPAPFSHAFEHVVIALQNLAGAELSCTHSSRIGSLPSDGAAVPYEEADVCIAAAGLALDWIGSLLPVDPSASSAGKAPFDFEKRREEFLAYAERHMLQVQDRALMRAALARDVPVIRLVGRFLQLGQGRFAQRVSATKTSRTHVVGNDLAANKDYSRRLLREVGLPVPLFERVYRGREAVEAARRIGYPVVVKPNNGSMGGGVSVGMKNRREVTAAYKRARALGRSVLVEEMVEGADFRMLVIDGVLRAAAKRVPAHVVGDGSKSIEELVREVNADPRRGNGQRFSWTRIEFDEQADRLLAELDYTRASVPEEGEVVYLRRNANTSDGGTAVDVTDDVHPDNREIAERAAKTIGLDIAGVDFLTTNIADSMWTSGGRICEVNSRPGLRKHIWPAEGKPRDVLSPIVDSLFPPDRASRIPIVAVSGNGNTAATARILAHMLASTGRVVGLCVDHRVQVGTRAPSEVRVTAPAAARMILLDPEVEAAVLEITPDDVIRDGLGCDAFDVAVILTEGEEGEGRSRAEVSQSIGVVARTARRSIVLSESDELAKAAASGAGGAKLCPVSATDDDHEPVKKAADGSTRFVFDRKQLAVHRPDGVEAQIPMFQPTSLFGFDADESFQGVLYACAALHSLGIDSEEIARTLARIRPARSRKSRQRGSEQKASPQR